MSVRLNLTTALLTAAALSLLAALAPARGEAAGGEIRTSMNKARSGDLVETIPISRKPWGKARSVQSLGPGAIGVIREGKVIEGGGDLQLTICIRAHPNHPGSGQPCVGRYHSFDPRVKAQIVLAKTKFGANPARTVPVSRVHDYKCTERWGHRNRHCVQSVPWSELEIDAATEAFCADGCFLNLAVSAYHRRARKGHKVVVGSSDDRKRITQRRSQIASALHPTADTTPLATWSTSARVTRRPPVAPKGGKRRERVVYSKKITGARKGDQLLVEARPWVKNGHLPYPTREHWSIVLSSERRGTEHENGLSERIGEPATPNGFTCTRNSSGHQSPCHTFKTGVISVTGSKDFYVNVVVAQEARGIKPQYSQWRSSQRTKIPPRGYLEVRRYRGEMSCATCGLSTGFTPYSLASPPHDNRILKLVRALDSHGIKSARYKCWSRRGNPGLICDWRASGSFGSRSFSCDTHRARYFDNGSWKLKLCGNALAADLWNRLERRGDDPWHAGNCRQTSTGNYRCRWYANHGTARWCDGHGTYRTAKRRWTIDACRP